uniref:Uncharacterized protein n=1 Tax=Klebsiella phage HenuGS TaxID=3350566 RepID=A0AB74UR88_9CAUD
MSITRDSPRASSVRFTASNSLIFVPLLKTPWTFKTGTKKKPPAPEGTRGAYYSSVVSAATSAALRVFLVALRPDSTDATWMFFATSVAALTASR